MPRGGIRLWGSCPDRARGDECGRVAAADATAVPRQSRRCRWLRALSRERPAAARCPSPPLCRQSHYACRFDSVRCGGLRRRDRVYAGRLLRGERVDSRLPSRGDVAPCCYASRDDRVSLRLVRAEVADGKRPLSVCDERVLPATLADLRRRERTLRPHPARRACPRAESGRRTPRRSRVFRSRKAPPCVGIDEILALVRPVNGAPWVSWRFGRPIARYACCA